MIPINSTNSVDSQHAAIGNIEHNYIIRLRGINLLSHCERLTKLELNTLELRRRHNDLVMCYKIVFSLIDVNFTDFFLFSPSGITRGHQFKLY